MQVAQMLAQFYEAQVRFPASGYWWSFKEVVTERGSEALQTHSIVWF